MCLAISICVQKFIEFKLIITELCFFMYLLNLLTQLVTSQLLLNQQFMFYIFANYFGTKRDSLLQ